MTHVKHVVRNRASHGVSRGLRPRIEEYLAKGLTARRTAELTGSSQRYVEDLAASLRARPRSDGGAHLRGDEAHYIAVRALGGFKALDLPRPRIRLVASNGKLWEMPSYDGEAA